MWSWLCGNTCSGVFSVVEWSTNEHEAAAAAARTHSSFSIVHGYRQQGNWIRHNETEQFYWMLSFVDCYPSKVWGRVRKVHICSIGGKETHCWWLKGTITASFCHGLLKMWEVYKSIAARRCFGELKTAAASCSLRSLTKCPHALMRRWMCVSSAWMEAQENKPCQFEETLERSRLLLYCWG